MFCDLVESTALGEHLDPEELHDVVRAYQQTCTDVIGRHGGHVSQYAGDGLVVYFGYPLAHEDDAERAIQAGLDILQAIAALNTELDPSYGIRLALRIGIHSGPVVVAGTRGADPRARQVLGHTVNLTARLQAVAEPDSVVTTAATLNLARGFFVTTDLGSQTLKGIAEPVTIHRIVGRSSVRTRLEGSAAATGLTPFVGREQELALLDDRFQQATRGQGQVVLLLGEAGIGKSRLVQMLRQRLSGQTHTWLEGHCSPHHEHSPFRPVIALLEQALSLRPDDTAAAKIAVLERALAPTGLPLPKAVPLMASLLSVPLSDAYAPPALSAEGQRQRTLDMLAAWLVSLSARQSCVVVLEDLHWIDPSTRELVHILLEQSATARMLLLVTSRPGFDATWPSRSNVTHLTLQPLAREQVSAMIERLAGGMTVPAELHSQVVAKTDGVPLFVEELTKAVLESELLHESPGPYRAGVRPAFAVPSTLQDSLTARLDRLGPAKEIAQLAAVLGREFPYELLRAVAPGDAMVVDRALRELARAELVHPRGVAPHASYRFKHALVQEAAYRSLLRSRRQDAHARVVCVLEQRFPERVEAEPEEVGRHCAEAGLVAEAVRYYRLAGQRASQRSAHAEAVGHLSRGLELVARLPEGPERDRQELELRVALGFPLVALHGYGAARVEEAYERARVLCQKMDGAPHLFEAVWGLANYYQARGVLDTAQTLAEQLVTIAEGAAETRLAVWAHLQLGATLFFRGDSCASLRQLDLAIAQHDPTARWFLSGAPEPGVAARVYAGWVLWELGYPDRALRASEEGVALARACEHPFTLAIALAFHASLLLHRREPAACRVPAEEVIALATAQEYPLWRGMGHVVRGWALARSERGDAGIDEMQQGLSLLATTGTEVGSSLVFFQLADASWAAHRVNEALSLLETGLGIARERGHGHRDADLYRLKGDILQETADDARDDAERCYRRALERAASQRKSMIELRAALGLCRLRRRRGQSATEARDALQSIYGRFTEGFDTPDLQDARAMLEG